MNLRERTHLGQRQQLRIRLGAATDEPDDPAVPPRKDGGRHRGGGGCPQLRHEQAVHHGQRRPGRRIVHDDDRHDGRQAPRAIVRVDIDPLDPAGGRPLQVRGHGAKIAVVRQRQIQLRRHDRLAARHRDERLAGNADRRPQIDEPCDVPLRQKKGGGHHPTPCVCPARPSLVLGIPRREIPRPLPRDGRDPQRANSVAVNPDRPLRLRRLE